jgi:hypothetical protein
VRSPETTTVAGFERLISMIVRSRSSGMKRALPQWMSLIWQIVNWPLPTFRSNSGVGLLLGGLDRGLIGDAGQSSTCYARFV